MSFFSISYIDIVFANRHLPSRIDYFNFNYNHMNPIIIIVNFLFYSTATAYNSSLVLHSISRRKVSNFQSLFMYSIQNVIQLIIGVIILYIVDRNHNALHKKWPCSYYYSLLLRILSFVLTYISMLQCNIFNYLLSCSLLELTGTIEWIECKYPFYTLLFHGFFFPFFFV